MTEYLYGMHDPGGEYLFADMPGWIVFTEAIGCDANDKSGRDYSQWSNFNILVRLNNGYGNTGTIPTPDKYDDFAIRVANFIRASKGCDTWIIGNEPNHSQERPNGQAITPAMYIDCYKRVHGTVRIAGVGTRHGLIPAPVALWNVETGDWLEYQETVWRALWKLSAGVALHTYTHGPSPSLITSPETMQAPFQNRYYHFRAYRDLMNRVPTEARGLPAYITETDQNDPWNDANSGWVQEAYKEIDRWNQSGLQKIHCLALYRWPKADQWGIVDKPGVHADLRAAVGKGYTSPTMGATTMSDNTTFIPAVSNGTQVPALPPSYPADWDPRLTERGVKIERVLPGAPGTLRWRVTKGVWMDEKESQGRHHFYADVYADNEPVVGAILAARWPGDGYATFPMEAKPGEEPGANFPMSKSRNEFSFQVNEPKHPSDVVTGVGMGAATPDGGYNIGIHTSTYIEWTLDRTPLASSPPAPTGPTTPMWVAVPAGARLRGAPTTNANVLQAIPFGQRVESFGTEMAQGAPWNHVSAPDGQQGWILGVLLSPTEPAKPPVTPTTGTGPTEPVKPPTPTSGALDPRVLEAVLNVESGGRGFGDDGRLLVRFEAHIFKQYLPHDQPIWKAYFRTDADHPWMNQEWRNSLQGQWRPIHTGKQEDEYAAFDFARGLNAPGAYNAISMGAAQIVGFNHGKIGYASASDMFAAFKRSVNMQIIGFINFCLATPGLPEAMAAKNWERVAALYNGSGNVPVYSKLLREAYESIGG